MNSHPLISVIVSCYNQGQYLPDALQSVLDQTYTSWECIIINDGATDNTEKVALEWVAKDERFKYFKQPNSGLSAARNKGLNNMTGSYVQFLDADDKIGEGKFESSIAFTPAYDLVISNFSIFTDSVKNAVATAGNLKNEYFNYNAVLTLWDEEFVIPIHCGLFKASLFNDIRFNEKLKAKEDWLMWVQVFLQDVNVYFLNDPQANYRMTGQNMSQQRMHMNSNHILALSLLYDLIPESDKKLLFTKALRQFESKLDESDKLLSQTKQSSSYKLGNFFIRPLRRIFKRTS